METKASKMLDGDFTPQARLFQHLKDVHLILSSGEKCGAFSAAVDDQVGAAHVARQGRGKEQARVGYVLR